MHKLQPVEELPQRSVLPKLSIGLRTKLLSSQVPDAGTEIRRCILHFLKGSSNV